jgi:DNA-binding MarR family transcriptional regulator
MRDERRRAIDDARVALRDFLALDRRIRGQETQRQSSLSYARYAMLRILEDREEHLVGQIATAANMAPATATRLLDKLEAAGLVQRMRCTGDRRRVSVKITPAGLKACRDMTDDNVDVWQRVLAHVDVAEIDAIGASLRYLVAVYDEYAEPRAALSPAAVDVAGV